MPIKVFLSHTHNDVDLAVALRDLFAETFAGDVQVQFSSDRSPEGGIAAGSDWREWIREQVQSCDIAVVVLSPQSLAKPWLFWEAGAISGVALAAEKQPPIIPLLYRVRSRDVPSPLGTLQAELGETAEGISRLLYVAQERLQRAPRGPFEIVLAKTVPDYLAAVQKVLRFQPQALTDGGVQEWCERLDELRREGRFAQVGHLHRALLLAVGPVGDNAERVPLDVRLHRRLGQLYLDAMHGREAVAQFQLALGRYPRDLFLLHKLGMAQLLAGDAGQSRSTLDQIVELDPAAATENPEIAGLKGRLYRELWESARGTVDDLRTARDAYRDALDVSPDSYYLAGNVGELSLALGEREAALAAYDQAVTAITRTGERSVWSLATLANAALARAERENYDEALPLLTAAGETSRSARDTDSIRQGLRRVARYLPATEAALASWEGALTSGTARAAFDDPSSA